MQERVDREVHFARKLVAARTLNAPVVKLRIGRAAIQTVPITQDLALIVDLRYERVLAKDHCARAVTLTATLSTTNPI